MKYEVEFAERVIDLLIEEAPPEVALDGLEQFVDERLAVNPSGCLKRISSSGAMQCHCSFLEREIGCVHVFLLRVHYGEDEQSLIVYEAFYYTFER